MKTHTTTRWGAHSPPAYLSNGLIGFRFGKNPFCDVVGLLAGFTTLREQVEVQAMAVLPTPRLSFQIDGTDAEVQTLRQEYDFSCGELTTYAQLIGANQQAELRYCVVCSRTAPTLLLGELTLTGESEVRISLQYDTPAPYRDTLGSAQDAAGKRWQHSRDGSTSAGIAFGFAPEETPVIDGCSAQLTVKATPRGRCVRMMTSYVPSVLHAEPHNQAYRLVKLALWQGMEALRQSNRDAWATLWESRITVEGAGDAWQDVIDASFFYLMSSVSPFSPTSVSPYGLSQPDAYEGHVFWDAESFMLLPSLLFAPQAARAMLDYRSERLTAARNNARLNGYAGLQFPWQSGRDGCEVTVPWCAQAGEQHVNLDVALGFDLYARVTGDAEFARGPLWEVLRGVSEWIVSRVTETARGFEILHVTGIDEEIDNVNNDAYTNVMAAAVLRSAADWSEQLGLGARAAWRQLADRMYLPVREDGVLLQYEGMPDRPVVHPTALMVDFPYGCRVGDRERTLAYYVSHGMYDYCRYPMLSGFMGVYPARLGDRREALRCFERANLTFFCEPFFAPTEMSVADPRDRIDPRQPMATCFLTGRASLLAGLVFGLTGLCPWQGAVDSSPEQWLTERITLPEGWERVTVGKVYLRGRAYRLSAEQGAERAVLQPL